MFIRKVPHKDKKNRKQYYTYKLVESVRTQRGPRQRDVLNLGVAFQLPKKHWKDLANCIEAIITKQKLLFDYPDEISSLAKKYARTIIRQQSIAIDSQNMKKSEIEKYQRSIISSNDTSVSATFTIKLEELALLLSRKIISMHGATRLPIIYERAYPR